MVTHPVQTAHLSIRRGANEETEQAVLKYGARVPEFATKHYAKSHDSADSSAGGQVVTVRGLA